MTGRDVVVFVFSAVFFTGCFADRTLNKACTDRAPCAVDGDRCVDGVCLRGLFDVDTPRPNVDGGFFDAGGIGDVDSGVTDAGFFDAGGIGDDDSGVTDAGDPGLTDAGLTDAGGIGGIGDVDDSGVNDAGATDGGPN